MNSVKDFESRGVVQSANRAAWAFFIIAGISISLVWGFAIYGFCVFMNGL